MVRPTSGFLTEDGNFFPTGEEAEFHEAETQLMVALGTSGIAGSTLDRFMELCVTHKDAIRRYVDAYQEVNKEEGQTHAFTDGRPQPQGAYVFDADQANIEGRKEDDASVQSQPDN